MTDEVLSTATAPDATVSTDTTATTALAADVVTTEGEQPEVKKPEEAPKTAAELRLEELERQNKQLQRGIDRKRRQLSEAQARVQAPQPPVDDYETVTLTRAEIQKMVKDEAVRLAPTMKDEYAEVERRTAVVETLTKAWGEDKFLEMSNDLEDSFGGLVTRDNQVKPAVEAIFESDNPQAVIEYFTDPKNAEESEAFAKLSSARAGRAIALLEQKLASAKPKTPASKVPAPLEPVKGGGTVPKDASQMTDSEYAQWRASRRKS